MKRLWMVYCLLFAASTFAADLPTDSIFAPTSFWYQPIPEDAPLHANSAAFVADFIRQKKAFYGTVSINVHGGSSPVFIAKPDVPTVKVTQWLKPGEQPEAGLAKQWAAVPIPGYAEFAVGPDAEMTIYQPSTATIWEFWMTRKLADGSWQARWGGRLQPVCRSNGIWPLYNGTTATGLPFLGGQITAEELQRGEIKHVIGIALVQTAAWNELSWPALRGDGNGVAGDPTRIPEGLRFRLDPSVNVDALPMHPMGKIIAKAAQKYGFVVWDKSGGITIRAQAAKSYTALGKPDPYRALWNGTLDYDILKGFPWDRLQFLPKDYGKPQ